MDLIVRIEQVKISNRTYTSDVHFECFSLSGNIYLNNEVVAIANPRPNACILEEIISPHKASIIMNTLRRIQDER